MGCNPYNLPTHKDTQRISKDCLRVELFHTCKASLWKENKCGRLLGPPVARDRGQKKKQSQVEAQQKETKPGWGNLEPDMTNGSQHW